MTFSAALLIKELEQDQLKQDIPNFKAGDTIKVHVRIVEGSKERIQMFQGVVIKRHARNGHNGTFTVRKISDNVGVERTFLLHSPKVEKIEVIQRGSVRRARLFYLRDRRGKAARIKRDMSALLEASRKKKEAKEKKKAEAAKS